MVKDHLLFQLFHESTPEERLCMIIRISIIHFWVGVSKEMLSSILVKMLKIIYDPSEHR